MLAKESMTQMYPTTVEFDVVFPRNDTYAPVDLMPIIFAIQNPKAVEPLMPSIQWNIGRVGVSEDWLHTGLVEFTWANFSTNPYFIVLSTHKLNFKEGYFALQWTFFSHNCSVDSFGDFQQRGISGGYNTTFFTLKNGSQQPNIVTDADRCSSQSLTYNVTGTMPLAVHDTYGNRNTCAVISEQPPPASPCAININETLASSMSSTITASACSTFPSAVTGGCPAPAAWTTTASLASKLHFGGISFTGVFFGLGLGFLFWVLQYQ